MLGEGNVRKHDSRPRPMHPRSDARRLKLLREAVKRTHGIATDGDKTQ